jgi:hypothetical protein
MAPNRFTISIPSLVVLAIFLILGADSAFAQQARSCLWVEASAEVQVEEPSSDELSSNCLEIDQEERSVVIARALSNEKNEAVWGVCSPYDDVICGSGWYKWKLSVDRTVSGPPLEGELRVAVAQHTDLTPDGLRWHKLFVL